MVMVSNCASTRKDSPAGGSRPSAGDVLGVLQNSSSERSSERGSFSLRCFFKDG